MAEPHWTNGHTGPLKCGRALTVALTRPEGQFWVNGEYCVNVEEAKEVFNSFLGLRSRHCSQRHLRPDCESSSSTALNDVSGHPCLERDDIRRVAMYICDPAAVTAQTDRFMATFDRKNEGRVSFEAFLAVLHKHCEARRLNAYERFFLVFEEPSSSVVSLAMAMAVMVLILVSSLGFILATDKTFQVEPRSPLAEPEPHPAFRVLEAVCIYLFTAEYLCRVCTVWAVRQELRYAVVAFPVLECFDQSPLPVAIPGPRGVRPEGPLHRVWQYVMASMNVVDLIAIAPFYLGLALQSAGGAYSFFRILRLARVFRIFKVSRCPPSHTDTHTHRHTHTHTHLLALHLHVATFHRLITFDLIFFGASAAGQEQ